MLKRCPSQKKLTSDSWFYANMVVLRFKLHYINNSSIISHGSISPYLKLAVTILGSHIRATTILIEPSNMHTILAYPCKYTIWFTIILNNMSVSGCFRQLILITLTCSTYDGIHISSGTQISHNNRTAIQCCRMETFKRFLIIVFTK